MSFEHIRVGDVVKLKDGTISMIIGHTPRKHGEVTDHWYGLGGNTTQSPDSRKLVVWNSYGQSNWGDSVSDIVEVLASLPRTYGIFCR